MEEERAEAMQATSAEAEATKEQRDGFLDSFVSKDETDSRATSGDAGTDEEENVEEEKDAKGDSDAAEKYSITVNGEEKEYSLDELKEAAQKGMDYDRLKADHSKVRVNTDRMAKLAREHGITVEALIEQAEQGLKSVRFETLRQKYLDDGHEEDVAEILANKDIEIEQAGQRQKAAEPTEEETKRQRDIELFNELYSNVSAGDIPEEVYQDIFEKGMTLVEAYQKHENVRLKTEAEARKQNEKNARRAVGSARTAKSTQTDAFLHEFLKE